MPALLLDLDGTLIDSEPLHIRAHLRFLPTVGIAADEAAVAGNIGKGDRRFYSALASAQGRVVDDVTVERWVKRKTELLCDIYRDEGVSLRPGVAQLLTEALARRLPLCVVTSSERHVAALALGRAELDAVLSRRVCYEDVRAHKPDPEPYRRALDLLGVGAADALAIEDSVSGVRSAAAAGVSVIGFAGLVDAAALLAAGAQRCVRDAAELLPL
jgi:HAD superfamily hydrolase (TIGR01509 family)